MGWFGLCGGCAQCCCGRGLLGLVFGDDQFDDVAHFFLLGFEVSGEGVLGLDFGGDAFDDAYAGRLEGCDFFRIVGHKPYPGHAKGLEHLCGELVGTAVSGETQLNVGFDGVEALVLQLVGPELGHEADAAALLLLVEQDSRAFGGNALECELKLRATVAAERAKDIAGEALRVDADDRSRGRRRRVNIAHDKSNEAFGRAGLSDR